ncbi:MAG: hypothetical protein IPP71_14540 [Bacteroidetes bacterium]|nr:hypothetical protein [Bacteroidota bacterium]
MTLYFSKEKVVAQRASWVVATAVMQTPELIDPFLKKLIQYLNQDGHHHAVLRNGVKVLEFITIPVANSGQAVSLFFRLLADPNQPIAIRCYAMTVLSKIAVEEPDLKQEIVLIIKDQLPYASAGFRSRAKRCLKTLEKL